MLVPFELNQSKIAELQVPQHVADWHRVRILKEIDDIRFDAMFYGNIDLTAEAMIKLKKMKLFRLFNPVFDSLGKVTGYDKIVEVFDIPLSWYISQAEELRAYCKRNSFYFNWQQSIIENSMRVIFDIQESNFVVTQLQRNPGYLPAGTTPESLGYCLTHNVPTDTNGFKANYIGPKRAQSVASDWEGAYGKEYFTPKVYPQIGMTTDVQKYTGIESMTPLLARVYRVDMTVATVPEIIKCMAVLGNVSAYLIDGKLRCSETRNFLTNCEVTNDVKLTKVSCYEPNYYLNFNGTVPPSITMADSNHVTYQQSINKTMEGYYQWYELRSVTLHNGKTYTYPWKNYYYDQYDASITPPRTVRKYSLSVYDVPNTFSLKRREFYDKNFSQFNFPPYFPTNLQEGDFRVRNGLLYADATNMYELQFIEFPEPILDIIENLLNLQDSIVEFIGDMNAYPAVLFPVSKARNYGYTFDPAMFPEGTSWVYVEAGVLYPFLHPVSGKPVDAGKYSTELVFESVIEWGKAKVEIDKFLDDKKARNDYAFNQAYQRYLQGQATISGPAALAEFERKIKTGVFYYENGYEYWRPFTALEISLIEQFKNNALQSNAIFLENERIQAQNKIYQDQVNQQVIMDNAVIISDAQVMADNELKKIADSELATIKAPTIEYLYSRAATEGGLISDALQRWVNENPYYYLRPDVNLQVETLLAQITKMEQQVSTALVADIVAEVQFTKTLMELFTFLKG